MKFLEW